MPLLQGNLWTAATMVALSGLPLFVNCAPAPDWLGTTGERQFRDLSRRQLLNGLDGLLDGLPLSAAAITQTVVSTVLETRTATTYTTIITASTTFADASPTPSSNSSNAPGTTTALDPAQNTIAPGSSASSQSGESSSSYAFTVSTVTQTILVTSAPVGSTMTSSVLSPTQSTQASDPPPIAMSSVTSSSGSTSSSMNIITSATPISSSSPSGSASGSPISSNSPATPSDSPSADPGVFNPGQSTQHAATRPASQKPLVMAYYPEWAASAFPPENIDFARFDWIDFAFAVPTQNFGLGWDGDDDSADLLRRLVSAAHQNGKRVKLSVGGWTGSKYFSPAVSKPANRQTFVNSILAVYNQFALDGIDIDWEFPAEDGNKGNIKSPNDTANFLAFLQLLRKTLPQAAKISAATMTVPWLDPQGNPSRDVSKFAGVLDWILVMNYDTWGSSSVPGPNAPLSNACHNSTQSSASAVAAVMSWTSAGFPASKIVMGVPSYGYISRSGATNLMTRSFSRSKRAVPKHLPMHVDGASQAASIADSEANVSAVGEDSGDDPLAQMEGTKTGSSGSSSAFMVHNEDGGTDDGQVQFRDLVKQKVLQYLSAWSTSTRAAVAATVDDGESDDDSDGTQGDGGGGGAEQSNPEPSSNGDSGDSDDSGDPSQAGVTSIAFAGQQIINVFNGQNGFVRQWDACSSTPYLRSASARQVITYDDPQSLEMKAVFVRAAGLLGVNLFDIHGDTDKWDLTDGIRRGLGL